MIKIAIFDDEKECPEKIGSCLKSISEYDIDSFLTDSADKLIDKYKDGAMSDILCRKPLI